MRIRFWGVRGSLPAPLLASQVREKLGAILRQALPEDLADAQSRERFVSGLPPWLFGTVGGNTSCVSVNIDGFDEQIVLDCGSGIREFGVSPRKTLPSKYHILLSHFHWDHLQGLPFFGPAYNPAVSMDFYSPQPGFKGYLDGLMCPPYSPVRLEDMPSDKSFRLLESPVKIGPAAVHFRKVNHPCDAFAYKITHAGKRFIYATDVELVANDFELNAENTDFFADADLAVVDAQYTPMEAAEKYKWGHSPYSMAVEFAMSWRIKHLVLFHHDPSSDDRKLHEILQAARHYRRLISDDDIKISLACEGMEIVL